MISLSSNIQEEQRGSKGVMLTHQNILANTEMCSAWMYDVKEGAEKVLGIVPFFTYTD